MPIAEQDPILTAIIDAVRTTALGPDYKMQASSYPLSAVGGHVNRNHWYPCPAPISRRGGHPSITVYNNREHAATVVSSPSGKKTTVFVEDGVEVIRVSGKNYSILN